MIVLDQPFSCDNICKQLQYADVVQVLVGLHNGGEVDMGSQAQEMVVADDTHLEEADNVDRRFLQQEGIGNQDD
jgi:hypothetical protein